MLKWSQMSKSGFIRWSSNQAISHLGTNLLERLYKIEEFYRKKSGARELITEEKGWLFLGQDIFCGGRGWKRAHITDYPVMLDQKVADWLVKIIFLGEVDTTIGSGIKFGIMDC